MTKSRRGIVLGMAAAATAVAGLAALGPARALTLPWGHHADARPEAAADGPPDGRRFTFPYAAHVDVHTGDYAAQQFVEKELPAGLPMAEAVARATAARSACHGDWRHGGGAVTCRYSISAAADQASLGQEIWTLTLTPGPDGKLAHAAIDRTRAGLPGELGTRAVFHWDLGG